MCGRERGVRWVWGKGPDAGSRRLSEPTMAVEAWSVLGVRVLLEGAAARAPISPQRAVRHTVAKHHRCRWR